jgi:hypothetical protein
VRTIIAFGFAPALVLSMGCFTAELDPDRSGAFTCTEDADCPEALACLNALCERSEVLPLLEIRLPEVIQQSFPDAAGSPVHDGVLDIIVAGNFNLVAQSESDEHESGSGHIAVFLDQDEIAVIEAGALSGGIAISPPFDPVPGPHRLAVQARRNDGLDYDNESAMTTRLFFVDDGEPHVAISSPWPGTEFGLEAEQIDVEVAAINFDIAPPGGDLEQQNRRGHVHIYYDADFPECAEDSLCDNGYFIVSDANPSDGRLATGRGTIPDSAAGVARITAVLRHINHLPYRHPFNEPENPSTPGVIFNEVEISRQAR